MAISPVAGIPGRDWNNMLSHKGRAGMSQRSVADTQHCIRQSAAARRLALNITQADLARRSDVPLPTLKRFEQQGEIGLAALLRIAGALDALDGFGRLFPGPETGGEMSARIRRRARG